VRVFQYDGGSGDWVQVGNDIDAVAVAERMGWQVSLSPDGSNVAFAAVFDDKIGGENAGQARVLLWWNPPGIKLGRRFMATKG
jgi:hypothetical protein